MKRYLTTFFLLLTALILFIGFRIDIYWSGVLTWGLALISLLFAAYFTKYIPNDKDKKKDSS